MNKSCIVKPHRAGLFSLINNVITCMDIYESVHVDWSEGCLYGTPEDGNVWNHLFAPTRPPEGDFDVIAEYPDQWLTYINPAKLYKNPDQSWRKRCNALWHRCRALLEYEAWRWIGNHPVSYLSVLVRADTHAGEQIGGVNQTLERYEEAIRKHIKPGQKLFVMAGDKETLAWFKDRFPVVYYRRTARSESRAVDRHLAVPQAVQDAKNCLIEVYIASQGAALIHPISNMATAALYMNPGLESIFLE